MEGSNQRIFYIPVFLAFLQGGHLVLELDFFFVQVFLLGAVVVFGVVGFLFLLEEVYVLFLFLKSFLFCLDNFWFILLSHFLRLGIIGVCLVSFLGLSGHLIDCAAASAADHFAGSVRIANLPLAAAANKQSIKWVALVHLVTAAASIDLGVAWDQLFYGAVLACHFPVI